MFSSIAEKIASSEIISRNDAQWLATSASAAQLQELAQHVRSRYHQDLHATYLIMSIINYTNICIAKCDYCSFYRLPHHAGTYLLDFSQICDKIDTLTSFGGTMVAFNGGFNPKLKLQDYAALFARLHGKYPHLTFYEMTVAEFMFSCKLSKLAYSEGAQIMKSAGTKWITGGGAEVLDDEFRRRHSPGKYKVADYFAAQEAILDAGLGSTATMVIGFDESLEERLNHLEQLRDFQTRSGNKLPSFLCWTYKPWNNALGGSELPLADYLRWMAICRIYLSNFQHIRTSVLTRNEDAFQALNYGANDFDIPLEDEVTEKAGATISHDIAALLAQAGKLGYRVTTRAPFALGITQQDNPTRSIPLHRQNTQVPTQRNNTSNGTYDAASQV
jgi:cyclic dehypoxanthinyl futalosine synthase